MCKKGLALVAVVVVGGIMWTKFESHIEALWDRIQGYADKHESVEFKLERAKVMLKKLDKEEDKLIDQLAREQAATEKLQHQVKVLDGELKTKVSSTDATLTLQEQRLASKREDLVQHEAVIKSLSEQLETLRTQRETMRKRIEAIEAKLSAVKSAESRSKHQKDTGALNDLNQLLDSADDEVRVREKKLELRESRPTGATAPATRQLTTSTSK